MAVCARKMNFRKNCFWFFFGTIRNYHVNKVSQFYPSPSLTLQSKKSDKSTWLMLNYGLIRPSGPGLYHLMPLAVKSLEKLVKLVDTAMEQIGALKVEMSTIQSRKLWEKSGRWQLMESDLFKMKDRNEGQFCLAPTHEEAISQLVSSLGPLTSHQLPLKIYQITNKFRDEMRPKNGLIRGKQFLMKDLYSLDDSEESAMKTYNEVNDIYQKFFTRLGFDVVKVVASNGGMGGSLSHEYHIISTSGDDRLLLCPRGHFAANEEILENQDQNCEICGDKLEKKSGIELGHTFLLGTRYSEPFKTSFKKNNELTPLHMASYGLGLTRILAIIVEASSEQEEMRWPEEIAPFRMCIIPPKKGSREEATAGNIAHILYERQTQCPTWEKDVVMDDRSQLTIGRRLLEARRLGFPYIVVVGKEALGSNPKVELHHLTTGNETLISPSGLIELTTQEVTQRNIVARKQY